MKNEKAIFLKPNQTLFKGSMKKIKKEQVPYNMKITH